ncbi:hypothetical protein JR316_0002375 [Psilocybe cubensis]|uniref:Uncharacterized protein n=1 Tax=Psilocybe cubensis TaxID=181762 RepID=A0ACB8HCT8_PSICU|nr:hypothetical protein JR316_0002375 [Psilocybe cubensis]KAH9485467.1 hypothetical protein JR316_0002375 [Psilocybe cubensis]
MNPTPKPHQSVQRLNKAYVQVPDSPVSLANYRAIGTSPHPVPSSSLKENTPLSPFQLAMSQQHTLSFTSTKRKLADRDASSFVFDGVHISSSKKSRLSTSTASMAPLNSKESKPVLPTTNTCPEFPNGFVYCHQCNKKRDVSATLRCTVVEKYQTTKDKAIKERLCVNKYCKQCLKNRYNKDIEILRSQSQTPRKTMSSHFNNIPKPKHKELKTTSKSAKKPKADIASGKFKDIPKQKPKLKPLPTLKWTPVPVKLTQDQADERIFIREFILRFSESLDPVIAKSHIDELEHIGGFLRAPEEDDTVGWVNDMCVKAILVSLFGLLAKDYDNETARLIKVAIKDLRASGVNLNKLWAILATLRANIADASSVEGSATSAAPSDTGIPLNFPDPSPPPVSGMANSRSLRSLRQSGDSVNIVNSIQMIPVITSLIHFALGTSLIREDIEQSLKDSKDFVRDAKEATRIENERWEKVRSTLESLPKDKAQKEENRMRRSTHKDQITNIDNCLKIVSKSFVPRFTTLGTDDEGRVYYTLSPGATEREAAFEYLEVASSDKPMKPKKRGRVLSKEHQRELRQWSWFVAVWGKRPLLSPAEKAVSVKEVDHDDSDNEEEENIDEERWWGFYEPEEINKIAEYISIKSGLDDDADAPVNQPASLLNSKSTQSNKEKTSLPLSPRQEQLKRLVSELRDYASLLEWRLREDKCTLVNRFLGPDGSAKGKTKSSTTAISVEQFYH